MRRRRRKSSLREQQIWTLDETGQTLLHLAAERTEEWPFLRKIMEVGLHCIWRLDGGTARDLAEAKGISSRYTDSRQ